MKIKMFLNGITGLFPGKITVTVFILKTEFKENTQGIFCAEGLKIQLGVLILKFR